MKKNKKWLSVLLAVCMVLTTLIPAFSAFAAEDADNIKAFQDAVAAASEWDDNLKTLYDAVQNKDSISAAAFAKVIDLAADKAVADGAATRQEVFDNAFGADGIIPLTVPAKDAIRNNALLAGVPFGANAEGKVTINGKEYAADVVAAYLTFDFTNPTTVGEAPVDVDTQKALIADIAAEYQKAENGLLRQGINAYLDVTADAITATEAANMKALAGFMGAYAKYLVATGTDAATIEGALKTAVVFKENKLNVGAAYKAIVDYREASIAYSASDKGTDAQAAYDAAKTAYKAIADENEFLAAFTTLEAAIYVVDGAVAPYAKVLEKVDRAAADEFIVSLDKYDPASYATAADVKAAISELDAANRALSTGAKAFAKDAYDAKKQALTDRQNTLQGEEDAAAAKEFKDYINGVWEARPAEPSAEFNAKIQEVKAAYKKLSTNVKNLVKADEEAVATLKAIYDYADKIHLSDDADHPHTEPELEVITTTDTIVNDVLHNTMAPNGDKVLNVIAKLINPEAATMQEAIDSMLSDEIITTLAKTLAPVLKDLYYSVEAFPGFNLPIFEGPKTFSTTPEKLAKKLADTTDGQLANAGTKEVLAAAGEDWSKVPDDLDWGVKDYETFKLAVTLLLEGMLEDGGDNGITMMATIAQVLSATVYSDTFTTTEEDTHGASGSTQYDDPNAKYGLYSTVIVPIFEMLGVKDYLTPEQFKAAFSQETNENIVGGKSYFADIIFSIIDPLYYDVLPRLLADPVGFIGEYLPTLIYHLDDGCIFKNLDDVLLRKINILVDVDIYPIIMNLVGPMLGIESFKELNLHKILEVALANQEGVDVEGVYTLLVKISKLGTSVEYVTSENMAYDKLLKIKGDEASVINYLVSVVFDELAKMGVNIDFTAGTFVPVALPKYPHNGDLNKDIVNKTIAGLDETVLGFVNIEELINNAVATNGNAAMLLKTLYGEMAKVPELVQLGIAVTPDQIAKVLGEDKAYAELVEALEGKQSWDDVVLTITNGEEVKYQVNMGFTDGDFDGFVNAVIAYLRPLVGTLLDTGLFLNNGAEGSYGLYETLLVPVFEALGFKVTDSATLTKMYADAEKAMGKAAACDLVVKEVIAPVLKLLADVKAAPITTVLDKLPTLAYALQYNPDVAFIGNMLKNDKGVIDLAAMINPLLKNAGLDIVLPYINLDLLASAGAVKDVASASLTRDTYKAVVADKADAFIVVMNYLGDTIRYGKNLDAIKAMLKDVDLGSMGGVVTDLLNNIGTMSNDDLICMLASMFGGYTCPDAAEDGEGGEGDIGDMGDYAIGIGSVLAVFAAAGVAIVLLRRKKVSE